MSRGEQKNTSITRRTFLNRAFKAGASVAVAGGVGYLFYDAKGPSGEPDKERVTIPDFSMPELGALMAIARGEDRRETVAKALDGIGGIGKFIKKGDCVLLKVNAAFASPALLSATTHPDLVKRVIALCFHAGAKEVRVCDNPINDPASCFRLSGIGQAVESAGGKLILPKEKYFKLTTLPGGKLIHDWEVLYEPLVGVDKLIGITPLKDHHRSGASMTMKNWYGLLGGRRNIFHQDIHTIIMELAMMVRPTLVILDATTTMMTNGPTGGSLSDLKNTNTMIVSTDQVAADAFGCTLLGRTVADLPFISMAANAGVGRIDVEWIEVGG